MNEVEIFKWLEPVEDPELFLSIVGLGLVYSAIYDGETRSANVKMTLTSPACPMGDYIVEEVRKRLVENELIDSAKVEVVWEPKWDPKEMASEDVKEELGIW